LAAEILVAEHADTLAIQYREAFSHLMDLGSRIAAFTEIIKELDPAATMGGDGFEVEVPTYNLPGLRPAVSEFSVRLVRKPSLGQVQEFRKSWCNAANRLGMAS
jgi:hypothetical protein